MNRHLVSIVNLYIIYKLPFKDELLSKTINIHNFSENYKKNDGYREYIYNKNGYWGCDYIPELIENYYF